MGEVKLNLARKWRSKNFEEIIGQDLLIRMLKNGLYLQQFFPVYLFSGQRGCGKTTTARVFAAALNCERLLQFQSEPQKNRVPCLACSSCTAMERGKHPDFIEIDAASHTGVDNVRMLIDSASLLPLMGSKKIYLIDEAHMLSKAAFNALLKILEEPPASVVFILATTDPQKIIETVRSRCFQLFFKPVEMHTLQERLRTVCAREEIPYDDNGLATIVKQTEGSVRDALNLLEQIRFSSKSVTHEAVLRVLGYLDDQLLINLFRTTLAGSGQQLLKTIAALEWKKYSAPIMWNQLLELVRTALWLRYDVTPTELSEYHDEIRAIARSCSVKDLTAFLQIMYDQELLFNKTTAKHDFLEMMLLQICQRTKKGGSGGGSPSAVLQAPMMDEQYDDEDLEESSEEDDDQEEEEEEEVSPHAQREKKEQPDRWQQFIAEIEQLDEPLIHSIFVQAVVQKRNDAGAIEIEFSHEVTFFEGWLADTKAMWLPLLQKLFGGQATLVPRFTGASLPKRERPTIAQVVKPEAPKRSVSAAAQEVRAQRSVNRAPKGGAYKPFAHESAIDISDKEVWKKAHMILSYIPGTIKEIRG